MAYAYGAMAACGLSMVVAGGYLDRVPLPSLVSRYAETLIRSIAALSRRRSFQVRAYPITLTILIVLAVRLYLVAGVLDSPVSAGEAILLGTAMAVSTLVNIMPAGLGVREVALSATFVALGGSVETGLMVAAADRLISLVLTALVGILWMVSARRQNRLSTSGEERERLTQEEALLQS
jgi:uncharacterized protein (TIRG00374 family)